MSDSESVSVEGEEKEKLSSENPTEPENEEAESDEIEGAEELHKDKSTMTIEGLDIYKSYCPYIDEETLRLKLIRLENDMREMVSEEIRSINKHEKDDRK